MIKFFRYIRKDLMEKNKTGKYLKYAIGEIILVVFGILIAVQINDWNEQHKTKIKAKNYINKIITDLKTDTLNIDELIVNGNKGVKNIDHYFEFFNSKDATDVKVEQFIDSALSVQAYFMKYYPVNQSFKNMEASSNSSLLNETQRDLLISLAKEQEECGIILESQLEIAISEIQKSTHLLGKPKNFYKQLGTENSQERKMQGLLHIHLRLDATKDLYHYIESRGKKIKARSKEVILALQESIH